MGRLRLPAPASEAAVQRMKGLFLDTWSGRVLTGAVILLVLKLVGLPLPSVFVGAARLLVVVLGAWFLFRFGRFLLRTFLWRIRRKLILSYLFIAVVPLVLLLALFLVAWLLFSGLVGSYMVATEVDEVAHSLQNTARGALVDLPLDSPDRRAALERRLGRRPIPPPRYRVRSRAGRPTPRIVGEAGRRSPTVGRPVRLRRPRQGRRG